MSTFGADLYRDPNSKRLYARLDFDIDTEHRVSLWTIAGPKRPLVDAADGFQRYFNQTVLPLAELKEMLSAAMRAVQEYEAQT